MLFITNRRLVEGSRSSAGRRVSFDLADNEPSASLFFCQRMARGTYEELTAPVMLGRLRRTPRRQILLFIHGFNALPEPAVFPDAELLQTLCDRLAPDLVEVVPLVWPCDDDFGLLHDYWDDQSAAEFSALAFSRALGKLLDWRDRASGDQACTKPLNILAHSMGNRVLRHALAKWAHDFGAVQGLFRTIAMAAADVANDCLDESGVGRCIADAARNVLVYHAQDDLALRTSKVVNLRNKIVSRRLGHTGPRDLARTPANVAAVDCDAFNGRYDRFGHSYYLADERGAPGLLLRHLVDTMRTGRPAGLAPDARRLVLEQPQPANDQRAQTAAA
jgi:esterase/lipase superfamily enzyme